MEYDGKILDLDHARRGRILKMDEYLHRMFLFPDAETERMFQEIGITSLTRQEILEATHVQRMPAKDMLQKYHAFLKNTRRAEGDETWWAHFQDSIKRYDVYPSIPLKEFQGVARLPDYRPWYSLSDDELLKEKGIWTVKLHSNEDFLDHPKVIQWNNGNMIYELDMEQGQVFIKESLGPEKYRIIKDPDQAQLFLRRVYLHLKEDKKTRDGIQNTMHYREWGGDHN